MLLTGQISIREIVLSPYQPDRKHGELELYRLYFHQFLLGEIDHATGFFKTKCRCNFSLLMMQVSDTFWDYTIALQSKNSLFYGRTGLGWRLGSCRRSQLKKSTKC